MPYHKVEKTLPVLSRYQCELLLHVGRKDIGNPELVHLCRAAASNGVAVSAWFLLSYEEHLYVGEETVGPMRDLSLRFADWAKQENLDIKWFVFDCEPSPILGRRLFAAVRHGNVVALARALREEKNPRQFSKSVEQLNGLIEDLHGRGIKVMGSANRVFLDFYRYGNTGVQDSLNAPFTMVHWDRVSFITYRYRASQVEYVAMINRYATLAHRYFGDKAALDVGLLGDQRAMPEHRRRAKLFGGGNYFISYLDGLRSVHDLAEVTGVSTACGLTRINLYSLDGAVNSVAGLDYWLNAAANAEPASGLERWTPWSSVRQELMGRVLNGLFSGFIGHGDSAGD